MYPLRVESALLGAVALLAACGENTLTAPPAISLAAATSDAADRPYTWSLKCGGDQNLSSYANWYWTAGGTPISGTSVQAPLCFSGQTLSASGVRPATADGFFASVNGTSQAWAVVPGTKFSAQLKGTYTVSFPECSGGPGKCTGSATGILRINS